MSLESVVAILDRAGVRYALIGAVAVAARGAARSTLDIDLLTTDRAVLQDSFWTAVQDSGARVDVRKGDFDDPLAGVIRIKDQESVDLVVGKDRWQRDIVERAEAIHVRGCNVPVPQTSDLILLKLFAAGYRDLDDIRHLLEIGPREQLAAEVTTALENLPQDMRDRWTRLLGETGR